MILSPEIIYRQNDPENPALEETQKILDSRGSAPCQYRNMLVFLAPDRGKMETLEQTTRRYMAWRSILQDEEQLNLDAHGRRQARENQERFDGAVDLQLEEAYVWLLYPGQEPKEDGTMGDLEWNAVRISSGSGSLVERASRRIIADGALVTSWSPVMLKNELDNYLWRRGDHVKLKQVWEDLAKYLYLPRVRDEQVLKATVRDGVSSEDYFGYATSVTVSGRYEGLKFGDADATVYVDEQSVLVRPDLARRQEEEGERKRSTRPDSFAPVGGTESTVEEYRSGWTESGDASGKVVPPEPPVAIPRRFYGVVEIDPVRLGGSAGQIGQEVVQHLASTIMGANVEVTLEIRADIPEGVPEHVERIVSENCRTLKFRDFGFEME